MLLPLTIEVAESQGTHVRLRVDGASPWVAVAAATFPRVMFEGFADLPTATGVRSTALSTRVVTVPIGATEPGRAALTFEQQQELMRFSRACRNSLPRQRCPWDCRLRSGMAALLRFRRPAISG